MSILISALLVQMFTTAGPDQLFFCLTLRTLPNIVLSQTSKQQQKKITQPFSSYKHLVFMNKLDSSHCEGDYRGLEVLWELLVGWCFKKKKKKVYRPNQKGCR